ncbi:helix-turn-helix domain-containing protein [Marinobacter hydrocarbonoclasticus]|nr:helix-turn-helix domain-containing protein [Marinobacter nauticus]
MTNLGKPMTKWELANYVWPGRTIGRNSLPVLINDLRKVLRVAPYRVVTLRGVGYMLVPKGE